MTRTLSATLTAVVLLAAWAALSLGVAGVADSVLVIVVLSLWWGRSRPVFSRYPKIVTARLRTS